MNVIEQLPAKFRKLAGVKNLLFPRLVELMIELDADEDINEWAQDFEDDGVVGKKDPHTLGRDAMSQLANSLGEQTVLNLTKESIPEMLKQEDWRKRQAGYLTMGYISEACRNSLSKNMEEAMKLACYGL